MKKIRVRGYTKDYSLPELVNESINYDVGKFGGERDFEGKVARMESIIMNLIVFLNPSEEELLKILDLSLHFDVIDEE